LYRAIQGEIECRKNKRAGNTCQTEITKELTEVRINIKYYI